LTEDLTCNEFPLGICGTRRSLNLLRELMFRLFPQVFL
jgi:hypothetical protein